MAIGIGGIWADVAATATMAESPKARESIPTLPSNRWAVQTQLETFTAGSASRNHDYTTCKCLNDLRLTCKRLSEWKKGRSVLQTT